MVWATAAWDPFSHWILHEKEHHWWNQHNWRFANEIDSSHARIQETDDGEADAR